MKRTLLLLAATLLAAGILPAQTSPATGTITTSSADCSVAAACVTLPLPANAATVSVSIPASSIFYGVLQFEATVDPNAGPSSATWSPTPAIAQPPVQAVTSATAPGSWSFNVAGMLQFRVRASALPTGSVAVAINASPAAAPQPGIALDPSGAIAVSPTSFASLANLLKQLDLDIKNLTRTICATARNTSPIAGCNGK